MLEYVSFSSNRWRCGCQYGKPCDKHRKPEVAFWWNRKTLARMRDVVNFHNKSDNNLRSNLWKSQFSESPLWQRRGCHCMIWQIYLPFLWKGGRRKNCWEGKKLKKTVQTIFFGWEEEKMLGGIFFFFFLKDLHFSPAEEKKKKKINNFF